MRIFVDDGSTNIKLAWSDADGVQKLISANSFKPEWSFSLVHIPMNPTTDSDAQDHCF